MIKPEILNKYGDDIGEVLFNINVHGSTFIKDAQEILKVLSTVNPRNIMVKFERDIENQYDENATKVLVSVKGYNTYQNIGFVPKECSDIFAYILCSEDYMISIQDVKIFGGTFDKEFYGLFIDFRILKKEV